MSNERANLRADEVLTEQEQWETYVDYLIDALRDDEHADDGARYQGIVGPMYGIPRSMSLEWPDYGALPGARYECSACGRFYAGDALATEIIRTPCVNCQIQQHIPDDFCGRFCGLCELQSAAKGNR